MQQRKKIIIILNPKAGRGFNKNILSLADDTLEQDKFEISIRETEYAGHATVIATEAVKNKFDIVACVGGDGTVNETAKALMNSESVLSIIPTGSGNGLARHLAIPVHAAKAFSLINKLKIVVIDTFTVNEYFAVNVAGVGFDAYVAHRFAKGKSRGFLNYIRCVIESYSSFTNFSITADTSLRLNSSNAWLISFANSSQFGNNAYVAPYANCADGILDITISQKVPVMNVPEFAYKLFNKKLRESSTIQFLKTQEAQFNFNSKIPLHIDGEPAGEVSGVHVKINPSSLKIVVP